MSMRVYACSARDPSKVHPGKRRALMREAFLMTRAATRTPPLRSSREELIFVCKTMR